MIYNFSEALNKNFVLEILIKYIINNLFGLLIVLCFVLIKLKCFEFFKKVINKRLKFIKNLSYLSK